MNFTTMNTLEYTKLVQQLIVVVVLHTYMHMSLSAPLTHKCSQSKWYSLSFHGTRDISVWYLGFMSMSLLKGTWRYKGNTDNLCPYVKVLNVRCTIHFAIRLVVNRLDNFIGWTNFHCVFLSAILVLCKF